MLFACQSETSAFHELRVDETLSPGTKVRLDLAPTTASGNGIFPCAGAPVSKFELIVP